MPETNNSLRDAPYLEQYFGLWAMEESRMSGLLQVFKGMDIAAHLAEVRAGDGPNLSYVTSIEDGIALVDVRGTLMKQASSLSASTSTVALRRTVRMLAADDSVDTVVMRIESPGGTLAGMPELADDVAAMAKIKRVIAYCEDLTASGGYFLASQASEIYANRAALVGSIGTYQIVNDLSGMAAMDGIKVHVVKAGGFKGAGVPGTEVTQQHLAEVQRIVNAGNEHFLSAVERGRGISRQTVTEWADGRVHPAADAMAMGMIDGVKSFDQMMGDLKKRKQTNTAGGRSAGIKSTAAQATGPESESAMSQTDQAQATTKTAASEPKPATIAELKASFPNDPSFALEAAEKAYTLTEAKAAYADVLQARLTAKEQELADVRKPAPGNKALGAGDQQQAAPVGDAKEAYEAKMRELMAGGGHMSREQAARHIVVNHPEIQNAYIEQANAGRKARR
jgi:signal peptide peptidase SppA